MNGIIKRIIELTEDDLKTVKYSGKENSCPPSSCENCVFVKIAGSNDCTGAIKKILSSDKPVTSNVLGKGARKILELHSEHSRFIKF